MGFFYALMEAVMGQVQRVFYFHVAAGWVGMLSFLVAAIAGVAYLVKGNHKWDIVGLSAIEIGIVFAFINIVTGSIWARPIWNTWWTWDPSLTTATIMLLGEVCTRACRFCAVDTGNPRGWVDSDEPANAARTVQLMQLRYRSNSFQN